MDAGKHKIGPDMVTSLFGPTGNVLVAKGQRVLTFDLGAPDLDRAALNSAILGPSGNLRAPTLRSGQRWLVGFHDQAYATLSE